MTPPASSCYLYAVARPGGAPLAEGLRGVEGAMVRVIRDGGLLAAFSEVPERDFSAGALRARLEDLPQLEALARAHHAVVDALAGRTAVLPLRLATLYRDEQRVREVLRERRAEFEAALERLADRREWGVKVYAPAPPEPAPPESAPPEPATPTARPSGGRSGRDYLRQRMGQRRQREDALRRATGLGTRADAELSPLADDVRRHRPQDSRLSGVPAENVLNAAYLVDRDREEDFTAAVRRLGARDPEVRVELTGPWAPYSFTSLDPVDAPARAGGEP